jgi:hypothetical protein
VGYRAYRIAYKKAFPELDLTDFVIDHIMNRRLALVKGFEYVRLLPISREVNSSHGALNEGWGVEYHSSSKMREINGASQALVQYADGPMLLEYSTSKAAGRSWKT